MHRHTGFGLDACLMSYFGRAGWAKNLAQVLGDTRGSHHRLELVRDYYGNRTGNDRTMDKSVERTVRRGH